MPSLWELVRYFLYLGSLGFGGPVALVGYMQRDLVEQRKWFSKDDYMKGLALSHLAPGPPAAHLPVGADLLLWVVFAVMALVTAWTESEIATLFILCGVAVMLIEAPPAWLRGLLGARTSLWAGVPLPISLLTGMGAPASLGTLGQ